MRDRGDNKSFTRRGVGFIAPIFLADFFPAADHERNADHVLATDGRACTTDTAIAQGVAVWWSMSTFRPHRCVANGAVAGCDAGHGEVCTERCLDEFKRLFPCVILEVEVLVAAK